MFDYALDYCHQHGARLIQPRHKFENHFYATLVGFNKYDLWIAATDKYDEGVWVDANDNSTITWTNWNYREPNNGYDGEHYALMVLTNGETYSSGINGKWNDIRNHYQVNQEDYNAKLDRPHFASNNAFICSKEPN